MAKAKWNLPDFNGVICEYEAKAAELDDAAYECVEKAQEIQYNAMLDGLRRHRKTGASMKALRKRPIERDANRTYTDLRIELHKGGEDDGMGPRDSQKIRGCARQLTRARRRSKRHGARYSREGGIR